MALNMSAARDTKWLTLEVCRQFQRGNCSRSDEECKFAHPPASCQVENGRVIACFDSIKGRCLRENCKYLHPPSHLKAQLEINGRNNLIQQKTAAAMLQQMQFMIPSPGLQSMGLGANAGLGYGSYISPLSHGMGLVPTDILPSNPVLVPASQAVTLPSSSSSSSSSSSAQKLQRSDKLEVCREFQRGNCARGETDCRFAHPVDSPMVDSMDNTVTVCMDYMKGRCTRDKCKYFHPPAHLQAKMKSGQPATQTTMAAQATAAALTQSTAKALKRPLEATVNLVSFPHNILQPLPKRQALEKSGWPGSLLNPAFLHYQHPLASAQLQQPAAAFYPAGSVLCMSPANGVVPMMYSAAPASVSAATSPSTSVPYAAAAPANQIILK